MISIVIPVYNEEENIELLCNKLISVLEHTGHGFEIIAVDDGSTDKTFEKMLDSRNKDDRIKLIKFRKNQMFYLMLRIIKRKNRNPRSKKQRYKT